MLAQAIFQPFCLTWTSRPLRDVERLLDSALSSLLWAWRTAASWPQNWQQFLRSPSRLIIPDTLWPVQHMWRHQGNLHEFAVLGQCLDYGNGTARYTGSITIDTSGISEICSRFSWIMWQVDCMCHLISASTSGSPICFGVPWCLFSAVWYRFWGSGQMGSNECSDVQLTPWDFQDERKLPCATFLACRAWSF